MRVRVDIRAVVKVQIFSPFSPSVCMFIRNIDKNNFQKWQEHTFLPLKIQFYIKALTKKVRAQKYKVVFSEKIQQITSYFAPFVGPFLGFLVKINFRNENSTSFYPSIPNFRSKLCSEISAIMISNVILMIL